MKLVFCGTPQFAVPSLERLVAAGFTIPLVVTQPDRPQGRGLATSLSAVKKAALGLRLTVVQPERIKDNEEFRQKLTLLLPDAIVVVGYGRIIPPWMLHLPRLGNINVHASLLPKYRGAAPIQWAIAQGETVTGVTTMRLNEGLDTGDILMQQQAPILPEQTAMTLSPRLAVLGSELLVKTLRGLDQGRLTSTPQDHSRATLAPILKRDDGQVDFNRTAAEIHNRLRGFQPWPGAYTHFRGKNLKIIAARPAAFLADLAAGELRVVGEQLFVGCGNRTTLELLQVQPDGKKTMSVREFIMGYRPAARDLAAS